MGAGVAGVPVDGNGSDGQTFPNPGTFVCAGDPACEGPQGVASHGGYGDRSRARDQSQTGARVVPMSGDERGIDLRTDPPLPLARREDRGEAIEAANGR